jgi:formylglycine-generating enzyme required for sulfatase activity
LPIGFRKNIDENNNIKQSYFSENATSRPDNPVTGVSWTDSRAFNKWLSEKNNIRYDLPTEAEWEYVARDGSNNTFPVTLVNGVWEGSLDDYAWNIRNSENASSPVGKKPNSKGIFDLMGNVWEWTKDSFDENEYLFIIKTAINPMNEKKLMKNV